METTQQSGAVKNKLAVDLKSVIQDAEDLLKNTGQQANEGYQSARTKFEASLQTAKEELSKVEGSVAARKDKVIAVTNNYVHEHPWRSVGAVAVTGLLFGLLVGRK